MSTSSIPMPPLRTYQKRLKDEYKKIKYGRSLLLDPKDARCLVSWLRRRGDRTVTREEGKKVRVWRAHPNAQRAAALA